MSRNISLVYFFMIMLGFFGCKKAVSLEPDEEKPEEILGEYYPDGTLKFLKAISVSGAEKVSPFVDSTQYIVDLPASYSSEYVTVSLSLFKGIKKANYTSSVSKDTIIQYEFKGREPLRIDLSGENGKKRMVYLVYFRVPGPIKIQLLENEIPMQFGGATLPFKVISGLGTVNIPDGTDAQSFLKVTDPASGHEITTSYMGSIRNVFLDDSVFSFEKVNIELKFNNRETLRFNNIRFTRGLPNIEIVGYDYVKTRKDTITTYGGYFSKTSKYRAEYVSDFSPTISTDMQFINYGNLKNLIPENIADGSYLLRFYEDDKLMGQSSVSISGAKSNSVEAIWQGDPYDAIYGRAVKKPVFLPGDVFYAKPSTFVFDNNNQSEAFFQAKNLPILKLKSDNEALELAPEVQIISWSVAGIRYMIGKYTLPKNMKPSEYTATFIFPDKTESAPYWSKIQVK